MALTRGVAGALARRIVELQATQDKVHLALTGGTTAKIVHEAFAALSPATSLDPAKLELWWTSERYVPTTDPSRNSTAALAVLARSMAIVSSQTHPMPTTSSTSDPHQAALQYSAEIGEQEFDICMLGLGDDGHVAAIFPNHPSMTDAMDAPASTRAIGVVDAPIAPPERMTLTFNQLNKSHEIWMFASGSDKADALARAIARDPQIPASHVSGREKTQWFVDEAAAQLLPYYDCEL